MDNVYLKCSGCNRIYKLDEKKPVYNCENLGVGNVNHILEKELNNFNYQPRSDGTNFNKPKPCVPGYNPYLVFKEFYFSYYLAEFHNINYDGIVNSINDGLMKIGEPAFAFTELRELNFDHNAKKISGYLKNETENVGGSHKARHLMGNIIYLEVLRLAGIIKEKPELAIYSCGNAAMGAAAIAKAAGYKLKVFIPEGVNSKVIEFLNNYDAYIVVCPRIEGESGDPCYNNFRIALDKGAVPFSCSGPDNWSNIEGGQTLCQELLVQVKTEKKNIDSIVIQVGGGALASSAIKTLEEFNYNKLISDIPKLFTVQTEGGFPLVRTYYLLLKEIADTNDLKCSLKFCKKSNSQEAQIENNKILSYIDNFKDEIDIITEYIKENYSEEVVQNIISKASLNKNDYMWSWETEPHSIAHGILDDITYDWFKIVQGMFKTGGLSVVISEDELETANKLGRELTDINVDHTGSSGFAGLLKLIDKGWIGEKNTPALFFTGVKR